jgi:hypothetical protein
MLHIKDKTMHLLVEINNGVIEDIVDIGVSAMSMMVSFTLFMNLRSCIWSLAIF